MSTGYVVIGHASILEAAMEIRESLAFCLTKQLYYQVTPSETDIHNALHQLRVKDESKYFACLKAFSSSTSVFAPTVNKEVINLTTSLGIELPFLVTPPLLHVVAPDLAIDPEKVYFPWHRDIDSTRGTRGSCVVWMPLTPVDKECSPLQFISHSHSWKKVKVHPQNPGFSSVVDDRVTKADCHEMLMEVGQLVVFSSYLIHRTLPGNGFRLALSWRLNDGADPDWSERNFYNPWVRKLEPAGLGSPKLKISETS